MVTNILMTTKARTNTYAKKKSGPNTLKKINVLQYYTAVSSDKFRDLLLEIRSIIWKSGNVSKSLEISYLCDSHKALKLKFINIMENNDSIVDTML